MTTTFKEGDDVTWSSQAAGSWTSKVGTVVAVVPAKVDPQKRPRWGERSLLEKLSSKHDARSNYGGGAARDHESYIVLVPGGKTDKARPVLYWPVASKLAKA